MIDTKSLHLYKVDAALVAQVDRWRRKQGAGEDTDLSRARAIERLLRAGLKAEKVRK